MANDQISMIKSTTCRKSLGDQYGLDVIIRIVAVSISPRSPRGGCQSAMETCNQAGLVREHGLRWHPWIIYLFPLASVCKFNRPTMERSSGSVRLKTR